MRSTSSSAIILGLFMLLLVLAASFLFLYQGRRTLESERTDLATRAVSLQEALDESSLAFQAAEATRQAVDATLATAVAEAVLLEGQLVESQQQVDTLTTQVDELMVDLTAVTGTRTAIEGTLIDINAQPPRVSLVKPEPDSQVEIGADVELVFVAVDANGITAVNLTIDGEPFRSIDVADETLVAGSETWTPTEPGAVEIGVMAVNVNGRASQPDTVTVFVSLAASQNETGTLSRPDPNHDLRQTIEQTVIELRQLEPREAVVTTLLSREALRQRVEADLLAEYTPADAETDYLVLRTFDLLPPDFDLYPFYLDLYSEQIAGFYDPETDEFVVVSDDDTLDASEQLTHAHEYIHALQDQYYDLDRLDDEDRNDDAQAALLALVEGEATLVQTLYMLDGYVDINELFDIINSLETPVLDNAPPMLANSLLFPYTLGLEFAQSLYLQDGFGGIDQAWEKIPQSTEQILHPERYLAGDEPQLVTLPPLTDTLGVGWVRLDENVFGEFMLRQYLEPQLNREQVDTAATGWGGDRYAVYYHEADETVVMVLRLVWDTDEDATEFAALYPNYPAGLFESAGQLQGDGGECWQGPEDVICLFQSGRETTISRAPDLDTAVRVATLRTEG